MMIKLLKKEFKLAMHPTIPIMMLLSAMVMIPNYPYSVIFFYMGLAIFFTCLLGRENNDIVYSLMLPVAKRDIVKARITFAVTVELLQMLITIPFAILSRYANAAGNQTGMDANTAFFGIGFIMFGIFNLVFFTLYYKNVSRVGIAFVVTSAVFFLCVAAEIALTLAVPFVRDRLDTPDPAYMNHKLAVLAAGFLAFCLMTFVSYKISARRFERQDL